MSPEKKQKIEKNLKIIAKREGITPEEVKSEIGRAVSYAMKSSDPKAQRFWNNFPCEGVDKMHFLRFLSHNFYNT